MAASDYNMYLLAQATTRARPANPPPTPTGRQESSHHQDVLVHLLTLFQDVR